MPLFTKESLETLRSRIDLIEVISGYVDLKPAGSVYKACCPFHDEKSPSFVVYKGDASYHCFGCGAHGDAVAFLMNYLKMSFSDAVENLAQRFGVHLEVIQQSEIQKVPTENKTYLKNVLEIAHRFYQFCLLHTSEGHEALRYLYERGLDLDFIQQFQVGWAPSKPGALLRYLRTQQIKEESILEVGLAFRSKDGRLREFFVERITFPIRNSMGSVIGFSARKYREEVYGGKYINTPETSLFKKSRTLFGLNYCRRRIAKEQKAIIVEGQIDALRLIHQGLNLTVSGLGTAFGEGHAQELIQLGVKEIYLALDGDKAGQEAARKIGNLFQKKGMEVFVVAVPKGSDPDAILNEYGIEGMVNLLENKKDYLTFLVEHLSKSYDTNSPAGKNELVKVIAAQIREWDHPLMVHESLRKLAQLTTIPTEVLGLEKNVAPQIYLKKAGSINAIAVNPHRIVEADLLRWLILMGDSHPHFVELAQQYLTPEHFYTTICRRIYCAYLQARQDNQSFDLLTMTMSLGDTEGQLFLADLLQKKVNKDRAEQQFLETLQKVLEKHWLLQREEIKASIHSRQHTEEELQHLVRQFDALAKTPPKINYSIE